MEMAVCSTQDILSNFPDSILENIWSRLSIRDVVRSSVLSTNWRYKWISVPHLIFNDECIPAGSDGSVAHDKLVKIINHVLVIHRGPILTFKITSSHLKTCSEIDSWIFSLSLDSLKKFKLQVSKSCRHSVLPSLFSFQQLFHLILVRCIIVPPLTFKGFGCLTILFFQEVTLSDATLKCLISSCPELQRLTLIDIDGPTHIQLSNPKLKYLRISGKFIRICLKDLKLLVHACFHATTEAHPDQRKTCNFTNIFGSQLGIQKLYLGGYFLQSLAFSDVAPRLSSTYDHLKTIFFSLNAEDMKEILVAICLLNSSPNLQKLAIHFWCSGKIGNLRFFLSWIYKKQRISWTLHSTNSGSQILLLSMAWKLNWYSSNLSLPILQCLRQ
ncbi:F-box/FBD/LRR-repeat protein At1g13570-like isoform X2 [Telopea speciosissima]|uniref:F-box/FBD/LRR-repeat protein At1g13570-like isoform X2 n=1 Tax=Telopea speciosissima TaxID=54955 RepID=UPI001CC77B12|nr:F-box/FBD/LRR-repeat protein At1g13570-like isoform X2 [Telopea speciosissima]